MSIHGPSRWLSFSGRAGRREFILQSAIVIGLEAVTRTLSAAAILSGASLSIPTASALLVTFLGLIASWAVTFRRLHDLGVRGRGVVIVLACGAAALGFTAWRTGWELSIVAYDVIWLAGAAFLGAVRGEVGENRFGPPPGLHTTKPVPEEDFSKVRQCVSELARPTLRLLPGEASAVSKLGGAPEMPSELTWPIGITGPLAFLAQIDLAEVRAAGGPDWLPAIGVLFFFNDDERYGFPDHVKVLFSPTAARIASAPPASLRPEHEFGERRVRFEPAPSAPSLDWLDLSPALSDAVEDLYPTYEPDHRLGGYPDEIQPACFPTDCERQARRLGMEFPPSEPSQTRWRLLLQVDADDELGMVWIDMGRLFVFVHEEDARAGDFSRAISFSQMY